MNIFSRVVGILSPFGVEGYRVPPITQIDTKILNITDTESFIKHLKNETVSYLKNKRRHKQSLRIELPFNSGGTIGSVFSAAKLWDRICLMLEREHDRSANTVSLRWVVPYSQNFENLLESSIRNLLTEDVTQLRNRAYLRSDFWKSIKTDILSN